MRQCGVSCISLAAKARARGRCPFSRARSSRSVFHGIDPCRARNSCAKRRGERSPDRASVDRRLQDLHLLQGGGQFVPQMRHRQRHHIRPHQPRHMGCILRHMAVKGDVSPASGLDAIRCIGPRTRPVGIGAGLTIAVLKRRAGLAQSALRGHCEYGAARGQRRKRQRAKTAH